MRRIAIVVRLTVVLLMHTSHLVQGMIVNGDFSTGLAGWTTMDTETGGNVITPSASVMAPGGEAVLATQGLNSGIAFISLTQDITIPVLATALSFDLGYAPGQVDSQPAGMGFPDFVQVSYLDATDATLDRDFLGLDINGPYDPATGSVVTLQDLGNGFLHFSTSIAALAGRSGTLFFDLSDQDDGFFSSASVDNVVIASGTTAVPEPSTWLCIGSGGLGLVGLIQLRRRREKWGRFHRQEMR